jgi:hypothetical protein
MSTKNHPPFSIKYNKKLFYPGSMKYVIKEVIIPRDRLYISNPHIRDDIFFFIDEETGCVDEYKVKNGEICASCYKTDEEFERFKCGITFNIEALDE